MNYCKYRNSDNYILEISPSELFEEGDNKVCRTNMNYEPNYDMYVLEINENNELIAHRGYLKGV